MTCCSESRDLSDASTGLPGFHPIEWRHLAVQARNGLLNGILVDDSPQKPVKGKMPFIQRRLPELPSSKGAFHKNPTRHSSRIDTMPSAAHQHVCHVSRWTGRQPRSSGAGRWRAPSSTSLRSWAPPRSSWTSRCSTPPPGRCESQGSGSHPRQLLAGTQSVVAPCLRWRQLSSSS